MRILVVHEVNYLAKIIYEFQILPEMLSLIGHDVTVVDYDDSWNNGAARRHTLRTEEHPRVGRAYPAASVTVRRPGMIRLPVVSRISAALTSGLDVARLLKRSSADVVLLYGLPTVGVQSLLAARHYGVPIIFRAIDVSHELVPYRPLKTVTRLLEKYVFNRVDFNVALTPHLKKYIQSYGVPDSRIRLLPSGVDTGMFSEGPCNRGLLAQWRIAPEDKVLLFMGTIYRFSGLDRVIRDMPKLLLRHPTVKLLILGTGEDESRLKQIAQDENVSASVVFAGMQPYSSLPDIIRSSDICINPFELNGITEKILPTKLFQYMACGKPVVATALPGTLTFMAGEQQGVLYAKLEDFWHSVHELLSDPARQARLGKDAARAARQYDWKSIAEQLAAWMAELAS